MNDDSFIEMMSQAEEELGPGSSTNGQALLRSEKGS